MKTAYKYSEAVRTFQPIEYAGLKFYPLLVKHFALYQNAKPAMELMLGTLPLRYVRMTWAQALDALDREAKENHLSTGYFGSFLLLLCVALRLDLEKNPRACIIGRNPDESISAVVVQQEENDPVALTQKDFGEVREILAAQNGYSIPDENWNPELVRAQAYLREQESNAVGGGSLEDAVFALAAATGRRSAEIWDWPLREYREMQNAVDRRLRFEIFTSAELSGQVKFTKGNPYPTWIWENRGALPRGFTSLQELDDGAKGLLPTPNDTKE